MKINLKIVFKYLFFLLLAFITFILHSCSKFKSCGLSDGPCFCMEIPVDLDTVLIDATFKIPQGSLAIANLVSRLGEDLPPLLIRLNENDSMIWARSLSSENSGCEIPLYSMSAINLIETEDKKQIRFFNDNSFEPGVIYLTDDYDFDYMCLQPF